MKDLLTWNNLIILIVIYVTYKIFKFYLYIKKYLLIYELDILEENEKNGEIFIKFRANFGRGFFRKKYFNRVGELKSHNIISKKELLQILTLTEINTFKNFNLETNQEYVYFNSKKELNNVVIYFKSEEESIDEITKYIFSGKMKL